MALQVDVELGELDRTRLYTGDGEGVHFSLVSVTRKVLLEIDY